jgi:hypothetical protein
MKYRTRIYYSDADKALMWDRRHAAADSPTLGTLINTCRTRRDIAWDCRRAITALDCATAGESAFDGES